MSDTEERMLQVAGPFYDTPGLVGWLGVTAQALDDCVHHRRLLGLPSMEGPLFYPTAQFLHDRTTVAGLKEALDILATGANDPWTWALWLAGSSGGEGSPTGWELLRRGDTAAVLGAARRTASLQAE